MNFRKLFSNQIKSYKKLENFSFKETSIDSSNKNFNKKNNNLSNFHEIYSYNLGYKNIKLLFRFNMLFIYLNSGLFFMEFLTPVFGKSIHSYILTVSTALGWGFLKLTSNLTNRIVKSIQYNKESKELKINFLEYLIVPKEMIIKENEVLEYTTSNLEDFNSFITTKTGSKKFYINIVKNSLYKNNDLLIKIFDKHK